MNIRFSLIQINMLRAVLTVLFFICLPLQATERLYVFYPVSINPLDLQGRLAKLFPKDRGDCFWEVKKIFVEQLKFFTPHSRAYQTDCVGERPKFQFSIEWVQWK